MDSTDIPAKWRKRGAVITALAILVLWVYNADAYLGLGSGQVTGRTMMSWSRPFRRGAGYGSKYYYLTVAGQQDGAPHEFYRFAPGVVDKTKAIFDFDEARMPNIRLCTIHYAGIGKQVVTDVEPAR